MFVAVLSLSSTRSFNRTFMELKCLKEYQKQNQYECFNRTFMELK